MPNDKVLVTGVAGFIGFHVAQVLLSAGREVVGLDNVNDYYDPRLKEARRPQCAVSTRAHDTWAGLGRWHPSPPETARAALCGLAPSCFTSALAGRPSGAADEPGSRHPSVCPSTVLRSASSSFIQLLARPWRASACTGRSASVGKHMGAIFVDL